MDIQLEKKSLMRMLQETNDFEILLAIKDVFTAKKKDFWDELSEEQKVEITLSMKEFEEGKFSDFEEFLIPFTK